jgi:hypothetical protein
MVKFLPVASSIHVQWFLNASRNTITLQADFTIGIVLVSFNFVHTIAFFITVTTEIVA